MPGLGGGAYRVRAFLPPSLAERTASVFFLPAGEQRTVDLSVESFAEPAVSAAVAPDPPLLDQPINLVVQVVGRTVDADGVVHPQPIVGASVEVAVSGGWQRQAPTTTTTTSTTSSSSSTSTSFPTTSSTTTTSTTAVPASSESVTDTAGQVTIRYTCSAPGPTQLSITVRVTPTRRPRS